MGPLWDIVHVSDRRARSLVRRALDLLLVAAAVIVTVLLTGSVVVGESDLREQLSLCLTVMAGAAALAAAVLWALVARLAQDGRSACAAAAFAVYGLIGIPATTLGSALETGRATSGAVRLTAHAVVVVLLLLAATGAARYAHADGSGLFWLGGLVPLAAGGLACLGPETAFAVTTSLPVRWTVAGLWLLSGLLIAARALGHRLVSSFRSGLGVMLLAAAHGLRIETEPAQPVLLPNLMFCALRLVALGVVLVGAVQLTRSALHWLGEAQREDEEQLCAAEEDLARLAERDHELRNGIAGLAGATVILRGDATDDDEAELRAVVAAEIARLDTLLRLRPCPVDLCRAVIQMDAPQGGRRARSGATGTMTTAWRHPGAGPPGRMTCGVRPGVGSRVSRRV